MAEKEGYLNTNAHLEAKVALLMTQLAESQAREAEMRDAIEFMSLYAPVGSLTHRAQQALLLPSDDSALRERIEAAKVEEREMCAQLCEQWNATHPERLAAAIRARGDK